jgi:hypothetical protein
MGDLLCTHYARPYTNFLTVPYDANGDPVGNETLVSAGTSGDQTTSAVSELSDGSIVVTFIDKSNAIHSRTFVYATVDGNAALSDTASVLNALTVSDIADLVELGVTDITVSDSGALSFSKEIMAQLLAIEDLTITGENGITVTGEGVALNDFTVAEIATLAALGVTIFDASDNAISLTVEQVQALVDNKISVGGLTNTTHSDEITLTDTAADLEALSTSDIGVYAARGVTAIDSDDNLLSLTVDQALTLIEKGVSLTVADVVTLTGTVAELTALSSDQLYNLAALGIDKIALSDTAANIEALTASQITTLVGAGLSSVEASGDLDLTVAQAAALTGVDIEQSGSGEYAVEET